MADCEWAILCDYTFKDQGGKICVIGIFERIHAAAVPATHHQTGIVLRIVGEPRETVQFRIEIIRPTGGILGKIEGAGDLSDTGTAQMNMNLGALSLPDFGTYAFQVYIGDQVSKQATFLVVPLTPSPTPDAPS